jgi:hypothetical protein
MITHDPHYYTVQSINDVGIQPTSQGTAVFTRRAVVAAASLLVVGLDMTGQISAAPATRKLEVMSDPRVMTYRNYLSAWSAMPDDQRAKLLDENLAANIVFTNSIQTRHGLEDVAAHLQGFQKRSPGASFKMIEMLGWENHGIATWQFVDAQGQAGFLGYDVIAYDGLGRIESILLFSYVEKQILK